MLQQCPVLSAGNLMKPLPTCSGTAGTLKNSGIRERRLSMDDSKHYLKCYLLNVSSLYVYRISQT